MNAFLLGMVKPFVLFALLLLALPFKMLAKRYIPEGKIKRLLFRRIGP